MNIQTAISRPIDEYRRMMYQTANEFAALLGISAQTYRKIVRGGTVEVQLQRQIARALGLPTPALIHEFSWQPSTATLAQYDADIAAANAQGAWQAFDLERGTFSGDVAFRLPTAAGE